ESDISEASQYIVFVNGEPYNDFVNVSPDSKQIIFNKNLYSQFSQEVLFSSPPTISLLMIGVFEVQGEVSEEYIKEIYGGQINGGSILENQIESISHNGIEQSLTVERDSTF